MRCLAALSLSVLLLAGARLASATCTSSTYFIFPTARVNSDAGPVSYFIYRDPRGASGLAYCRLKGFAALGSARSSPLSSLGFGAAINLATEEQCNQPACQAYLGIECVPRGATACQPDAMGNVGVGNIGADNFGRGCVGNNNIGFNNYGNDNVGVGNHGSRNLGFALIGDDLRSTPLRTTEGTLVLEGSTARFEPVPPQPLCQMSGMPPTPECQVCPKCPPPKPSPPPQVPSPPPQCVPPKPNPPSPKPRPPSPPLTCPPCLCNYPPLPPRPNPPRPPRPPPVPFPPPSPPQTLICDSICLVPNQDQTDCEPRMCSDPCQDCMEEDVFTWYCMDMDPSVLMTFDTQSECNEMIDLGECEDACFKCKFTARWGCRVATAVYYR
ncbi:hypothetical protein D9Q98_000999 [Chlorella vulgaris]|uniref:Uncharacterized protein n=1 Tax=Chlorella vulgaris TaxID=3077 RepID=A0A9D4TZG2_CHLVU|nr:hypothetical protein D9Q98_000999 [Chlorella vulgaris]